MAEESIVSAINGLKSRDCYHDLTFLGTVLANEMGKEALVMFYMLDHIQQQNEVINSFYRHFSLIFYSAEEI